MSGTGTGSENPGGGTGTPGASQQNPGSGGGAATGFTAITLDSQEAVNNFLAGRLDQKSRATRKEIADSLGVAPEKLDEHLTALKKLQQDHETDTQRREREASEAARKETETTIRGEYDGKLGTAKTQLIRAAVLAEAQKLGFRHPEDVWNRVRDDKGLTIDDDFVVKGVSGVVKKVSEERPEWVGGSTFRGSPPAGNGGGPGPADKEHQEALAAFQHDRLNRLQGGRRSRL